MYLTTLFCVITIALSEETEDPSSWNSL